MVVAMVALLLATQATVETVELLGAEEGAVTQLVDKEMGQEGKLEYFVGRR